MCRAGSKSSVSVLPGMTETCPPPESQGRTQGSGSRHQQKHTHSEGPRMIGKSILRKRGTTRQCWKTGKNRQGGQTKHRTHWTRRFKSALKTRKQTRVIVWLLTANPGRAGSDPSYGEHQKEESRPSSRGAGSKAGNQKQPKARHGLQRFQMVAKASVTATPWRGVRGGLPISWCKSHDRGQNAHSQTFKDQGSTGGRRNPASPGAQTAWGRHSGSEGRPPLG